MLFKSKQSVAQLEIQTQAPISHGLPRPTVPMFIRVIVRVIFG